MTEFKYALLQYVEAANGGKGIAGHVVAMMVSLGDVREYRVRYWHSGELKAEWLHEHELKDKE